MSVKDLYPAIRPSLNLDFANTKTLDPRITFSRASTGTYYDGVTHAKAEENLLLRSQEFDQSPWISSNATVTANDTTAPDGTNTADKFAENGSEPYVRQSISFTGNTLYVFSVFAKADTSNYVYLTFYRSTNNSAFAEFDLSSGTLNRSGDAGTVTLSSSNITSIGSGWYRIEIICSSTSSSGNPLVWAGLSDGVTAVNSEGRYPIASPSGESAYLWGAQLEERSSVTAYTATTTQPITNYIPVLQSAAAGEARFDHDPVTGESKGLLIEEQRTNLLTYSEDFSNGSWNKVRASIGQDVIIAPNGTLTGASFTCTQNTTLSNYIEKTASSSSGNSYTLSIFAKKSVSNWLFFFASTGTDYQSYFDLQNGQVGASGVFDEVTITPVGNDWYKCTMSFIANDTSINVRIRLAAGDGDRNLNEGDQIYIWGAQLEAGAFPTSYIATSGSQATRNADSASMTGTNFSEWFRQDEGTLYGEFKGPSGGRVFNLDNNAPNQIALRTSGSSGLFVRLEGTTQAALSADTSGDQFYKLAGAYKVNDFAQSFDGATAQTDTSGILPSPANASIGSYSGATSAYLNGHIKRLAYYPARLTNAQLQALTEG